VVALVQLGDGVAATPEELSAHASGFIARFKLPKEYLFLTAIQRSPSGKADYRWARAQVEA
jgi:fatty-acyl-CoA synthase